MRHITHALLTLSALLALSACGPSDHANSIAGMSGDATSGQTLYSANCASCHGATGGGGSGPNLVRAFNSEDKAELIDVILEGDGPMMGYSGVLSDQEIADIVAYLDGL